MLILIIGASASGKSEFAENLCLALSKKRLYLATMEPYGAAAHARILRHKTLRQGKGFDTHERYLNIENTQNTADYDGLLLECLSTLVANECYKGQKKEAVASHIAQGISLLSSRFPHVLLVSCDVFCDTIDYPEETLAYIKTMATLHKSLAKQADVVIEICETMRIYHKGGHLLEGLI